MLTVFKKFTRKHDEKPVFPAGVAPIGPNMQKKFARGVQFNMKIILKGDRNTGKSTLLHRLQGGSFIEEYIPTHEIQVANINWNYRGPDEVVKVEVWDVVDKSKQKRKSAGALKIANDETQDPEMPDGFALDAEFVDVFKGTQGVIMLLDVTKQWTWHYVQRELEKVPHHISVLVMANFLDMGEHRVVQNDEIIAHIENLERPTGSAEVYFTEASLKDGFGLRFVYNFLNMPFLILQRETLLRQLEQNSLEIEETRENLHVNTESEDQNYNLFKEMLARRSNPVLSNDSASASANSSPAVDRKDSLSKDPIVKPVEEPKVVKKPPVATVPPTARVPPGVPEAVTPTQNSTVNAPTVQSVATLNTAAPLEAGTPPSSPPQAPPQAKSKSKFQAYKAKFFGDSSKVAEVTSPVNATPVVGATAPVPIEEFSPGEDLDSNFLSTSPDSKKESKLGKLKYKAHEGSDDDDESDGGDANPMVAAYEDLESDEEHVFRGQLSIDGDYDDLSEDDRPTKPPSSEISKSNTSAPSSIVKAASFNQIHAAAPAAVPAPQKCEPSLSSLIPNAKPAGDVHASASTGILKEQAPGSSDEEEGDDNQYLVAGDIDVEGDRDWSHKDDDDSTEDERNDVGKATDGSRISNSAVLQSPLEYTSESLAKAEPASQKGLAFQIDELEMFMSDQLRKTSVTSEPEPSRAVKPTPAASAPQRQDEINSGKKVKSKKKKSADVSSSKASATISDEEDSSTKKKTPKKKKSSRLAQAGDSSLDNSIGKKKPKKPSQARKPSDSSSKLQTSRKASSDLDAFYEQL